MFGGENKRDGAASCEAGVKALYVGAAEKSSADHTDHSRVLEQPRVSRRVMRMANRAPCGSRTIKRHVANYATGPQRACTVPAVRHTHIYTSRLALSPWAAHAP